MYLKKSFPCFLFLHLDSNDSVANFSLEPERVVLVLLVKKIGL